MQERHKNLILLTVTVVLTLLACETALRLWHGLSPLDFGSQRSRTPNPFNLFGLGEYDRALGWRLKDHLDRPGFHTVERGIRRNSAAQSGLRPGHVLAVGSSFTSGVDVADEQSWPAQLERLAGQPVDNAAVGGYALDQIVLRAEQLLSMERPRVLLIGVMESGIAWSGYTVTFAPKPFFTVEGAAPLVHNIPVPSREQAEPFEPVIKVLSHSHVLDRLMARLDPGGWYSGRLPAHNDPVDVSCRLLQRLKQETDRLEIQPILVSELWASEVMAADVAPRRLASVLQCGRLAGYQIIDTFGALRMTYVTNPALLDSYYLTDKAGRHTHFSALGNRRMAEFIAAGLSAHLPPGAAL